jgi:hypothetical protein
MLAGALTAALGDAEECLGAAVARWGEDAGTVPVPGTSRTAGAGVVLATSIAYGVLIPAVSTVMSTTVYASQPPAGRQSSQNIPLPKFIDILTGPPEGMWQVRPMSPGRSLQPCR